MVTIFIEGHCQLAIPSHSPFYTNLLSPLHWELLELRERSCFLLHQSLLRSTTKKQVGRADAQYSGPAMTLFLTARSRNSLSTDSDSLCSLLTVQAGSCMAQIETFDHDCQALLSHHIMLWNSFMLFANESLILPQNITLFSWQLAVPR